MEMRGRNEHGQGTGRTVPGQGSLDTARKTTGNLSAGRFRVRVLRIGPTRRVAEHGNARPFAAASCGGSNDAYNLVTACRSCNSARGARPWLDYAVGGARDRIEQLRHSVLNMELARALLSDRAGNDLVEAERREVTEMSRVVECAYSRKSVAASYRGAVVVVCPCCQRTVRIVSGRLIAH